MNVFRQDMQSREVLALQKELNKLGAGLAPDGYYGPRTALAIAAYNRKRSDLPSDSPVYDHRVDWSDSPRLVAFDPGPITLDMSQVKILNVPWLSQRDNKFKPSGTCNVTCVAMMLSFYGIGPMVQQDGDDGAVMSQLEDVLFEDLHSELWATRLRLVCGDLLDKFEPQHIHAALAFAFNQYRPLAVTQPANAYTLTRTEVLNRLAAGKPVLMSTKLTKSGHIVLAVGMNRNTEDLVVHDPWGDYLTGYQNHHGAFRVYPASLWAKKFTHDKSGYYCATERI